MISRFERRQNPARERARVAAELAEEARLLTEATQLVESAAAGDAPPTIPAPSDSPVPPSSNNHTNENGKRNGNGARTAPTATAAERALAGLNEALAAAPDSVALLLERASQLGQMGRYNAARADLERALLLDPGNDAVRTALGIVLLRKGLWSEAVPHLRRVVEVENWSPTAWFYLGEALNHVDDLEGALAAYVRAVELDSRHSKALYGQAVVLDRLHRSSDAAPLYRRSREVAGR